MCVAKIMTLNFYCFAQPQRTDITYSGNMWGILQRNQSDKFTEFCGKNQRMKNDYNSMILLSCINAE